MSGFICGLCFINSDKVIEYLYDYEEKDYNCETPKGRRNHIFVHIAKVANELLGHEIEFKKGVPVTEGSIEMDDYLKEREDD